MFETHYAKLRPRKTMTNCPFGSLLYQLSPENVLFTQQALADKYWKEVNTKKEYANWSRRLVDVQAGIDTLVKEGFLKEIYGTRINNWLNTF